MCLFWAAAAAVKPEDWDEDEDGEWEPPKIANPACKDAPGCGEWKRPTKPVSEWSAVMGLRILHTFPLPIAFCCTPLAKHVLLAMLHPNRTLPTRASGARP